MSPSGDVISISGISGEVVLHSFSMTTLSVAAPAIDSSVGSANDVGLELKVVEMLELNACIIYTQTDWQKWYNNFHWWW